MDSIGLTELCNFLSKVRVDYFCYELVQYKSEFI